MYQVSGEYKIAELRETQWSGSYPLGTNFNWKV